MCCALLDSCPPCLVRRQHAEAASQLRMAIRTFGAAPSAGAEVEPPPGAMASLQYVALSPLPRCHGYMLAAGVWVFLHDWALDGLIDVRLSVLLWSGTRVRRTSVPRRCTHHPWVPSSSCLPRRWSAVDSWQRQRRCSTTSSGAHRTLHFPSRLPTPRRCWSRCVTSSSLLQGCCRTKPWGAAASLSLQP